MATPITEAETLLHGRGLWVTTPRVGLLAWFLDHPGHHPTLPALRQAVAPAYLPRLAAATAYQAVRDLTAAGLLEVLFDPAGRAHYGLRLTPHSHFYCRQCGRWTDIPPLQWAGPPVVAGLVEQTQVIVVGRCSPCISQPEGEETP